MNKAIIIGNLTRDPELRYTTGPSQTAVCRFTVAVNDRKKNQQTGQYEDDPDFIQVVTFGKQAENCSQFLTKGRKVAVEGKIKTGSYEKDGVRHWTTEVRASNVEFLGGGQGQNGAQQGQGGYAPQQQGGYPQQPPAPQPQGGYPQQPQGGYAQPAPPPQQPPQPQEPAGGGFTTFEDDDDIPF